MPLAGYLGTRYSFREHLLDGHYVWAHKRLHPGEAPPDDSGSKRLPPAQQVGTGA